MVFRRPYAFLIRHFKLIHLIITVLLIVLLSKNKAVYDYLELCIKDSVNRYDVLSYIDYSIYIFIFLILGLFFIVYWLLKYKDKPRNIYIFSGIGYIIIGIFMFVLYAYMNTFINELIDQKTIRMYRDIFLITLMFQYLFVFVMLFRGLGFDIKKFNFVKDIQELSITDEDGDEVEVNVGIDTTNVMREVRRQKREFGYFLKEYKLYVTVIVIILGVFFGYKGYSYLSDKLKVYEQDSWFGYNNYISITDSYYNTIDNKNYVVIKFNIYKYGITEKFNIGNLNLKINNKKYSVDKNNCYKFASLGNCYKKQYINNEVKSYVLAFSVEKIDTKNSYIIYSDSYDKKFKVKLNLQKYEE